MAIDKIILTNASAFLQKYGSAGSRKINAALKQMIAADAARGITSRVIAIDSPVHMSKYGKPVLSHGDSSQTKSAIDSIYAKEKPDYLLILGASDVIPFVPLKNPVYGPKPDDDNDKTVPSDLPYACNVPYSTDINHFVGPTRVVGRLPDLVGAKDPQYLLKLLATATHHKTRQPADFQKYFALSARVWSISTSRSISNLFGDTPAVQTVPDSGPGWTKIQLSPRIHFINCHGMHNSTHYFGQPRRKDIFPTALSANFLPKRIVPGTIMAAECCYGAQLFNPAEASDQPGIACTYLGEGAYGVFGSTTIAYGSCDSNSSADLLCQYFIQYVMNGSSLGRAALEARQQFAGLYSHLSPTDLKTIAQFYLLGDPSIHAVAILPHGLNSTKTFQAAFAKSKDAGPRFLRRERLHRIGSSLYATLPATRKTPSTSIRPSREITRILSEAARESGLREHTSLHFHVSPKVRTHKSSGSKRTIHLLMGTASRKKESDIKTIIVIIATAEGGKLLHLRRLHSR